MTAARPDTWMPLYWGDYLRDTGHLSAAEHGAYLLLIGHYWTHGGPLVDDDVELARIARMERAEWKKSGPRIRRFFEVVDGRLHHHRVDAELANATTITSKRRAASNARWEQERSKRDAHGYPKHMQTASPSPSPEISDRASVTAAPARAEPLSLAIACPRDFRPDPETEMFAALRMIPQPRIEEERQNFINHYRARAETRADWQAEFRKWLGRLKQFEPKAVNGHRNGSTLRKVSIAQRSEIVEQEGQRRGRALAPAEAKEFLKQLGIHPHDD